MAERLSDAVVVDEKWLRSIEERAAGAFGARLKCSVVGNQVCYGEGDVLRVEVKATPILKTPDKIPVKLGPVLETWLEDVIPEVYVDVHVYDDKALKIIDGAAGRDVFNTIERTDNGLGDPVGISWRLVEHRATSDAPLPDGCVRGDHTGFDAGSR